MNRVDAIHALSLALQALAPILSDLEGLELLSDAELVALVTPHLDALVDFEELVPGPAGELLEAIDGPTFMLCLRLALRAYRERDRILEQLQAGVGRRRARRERRGDHA